MGADQSTSLPSQLRSQRDEDIPYTSYSISKPIDGDTPKASPRLASKLKGNVGKEKDASTTGNAQSKHDIVVVTEKMSPQAPDPALVMLSEIPLFMPIMKGSLNLPPQTKEPELQERLDSKQVLQMCIRYQEHLKQCAEAVTFDQNALCVRIKEIDFTIHSIYNNMTERQKRFAKYAEQIQKVNEMSMVLKRVKMNVDQTMAVMDRLNSVLPMEDRLETFSLKPN